MNQHLARKYAAPAPRYTSYPTAPHFHEGVDAAVYRTWLEALPAGARLSLYAHIPYCDRLCWFCACHTKQTHAYAPLARYVDALLAEIATVGAILDARMPVDSLHFGGGSPTLLSPADMGRLDAALRAAFPFRPDAEISVEIDPNDMDEARFDALAAMGMTRASLGVQDFDPKVQKAINREQSFDQTRWVVDSARARGARSVNVDAVYGLPHQSVASVAQTIDQVVSLAPDRIALFGYAHVPWFKKHQTMIDESALPDAAARLEQSSVAAERIVAAGYVQIGLDHFALPSDTMAVAAASGGLARNFQGYAVDAADALIGLGASSIGRLPQGYVQNMPATGQYERMVTAGGLAAVRGITLSDDDRVRGWVIERLMCDFAFSVEEAIARFGTMARPVVADAERIALADEDGLFRRHGDRFTVTARGRPFVRSIAAQFDAYFAKGQVRHSIAV
jgi:oxygen-independent coproporphyrinogen-3 oxidase